MNKRVAICYPFFWSLYMISGKVPARRRATADAHFRRILNTPWFPYVLPNHAVCTSCAIHRKTEKAPDSDSYAAQEGLK